MALEYYTIAQVGDTASLRRELHRILDSISRRLNSMKQNGDNISLGSRRFTDLEAGSDAEDSVRLDQTFLLADLASVLLGTVNEVTVTVDTTAETATFDLPDAIYLGGATASRLLATDGSKLTSSVSDLSAWVKGDGTFITSTDDGSGGTDLDFVADYSDISTNDAATDVTGAELETLTDTSNADALHAHSHASLEDLSTGADHSYIDQDVTSGSSPTFDGTNFTGIPDGALDETYWLLAGRAGGQVAYGGTAASETFELHTTAHATKGIGNIADTLYIDEVNNYFGIKQATPSYTMDILLVDDSSDYINLNNSDGFVRFGNGTSVANNFQPTFFGESAGSSRAALFFVGQIAPGDDSGTDSVILFNARRSGPAAVATRPAYEFRNHTTQLMLLDEDGNTTIAGNIGSGVTPGASMDIYRDGSGSPVVRLRDGDISHAVISGLAPTMPVDEVFRVSRQSSSAGGAAFVGSSDGTNQALVFHGFLGAQNPADTAVCFRGYKADGASGGTKLVTTESIMQFWNGRSVGDKDVLLEMFPDMIIFNQDGIDLDFIVEGDSEDHLFVVDAGTDTVRCGDWDTNYATFAKDGELNLVGTARVRKEIIVSLDGIGKGATAPTLTRDTNTYGYAFTIGDDGYIAFETPDNWDSTTAINVYLHVYVNEDFDVTGAEMRFTATYSNVPEDGSEAIDGATHTGSLDSGDVNISTTAKGLQEIDMGALANVADHDTVFIKLTRAAINDGTEVTAEPVIVQVEYSYISNKLGEAT